MAGMFEKAIDNFNKVNGRKPAKVIVLRDGVGDSQKSILMNQEIPQIKKEMQSRNPDMKLLYAMVNTRIKAKFV